MTLDGDEFAEFLLAISDVNFLSHWWCVSACPNAKKSNKDEVCDMTCLQTENKMIFAKLLQTNADVIKHEVNKYEGGR